MKENFYQKRKEFLEEVCPTTKEQLLHRINFDIKCFIDNKKHYSIEAFQARIALCDKFKTAIKRCKLPELTIDETFYDYDFEKNGIELQLCEMDSDHKYSEIFDYELHQNDSDYIPNFQFSVNKVLLRIECDYLTVEQFAILHDTSVNTVNEWIQHAKLRHAKKCEKGWMIPSCEDKPHRKFETVQYLLDRTTPFCIDEFPFVSTSDSIWIQQSSKNRKKFFCIWDDYTEETCVHMQLYHKDIESLEYALISSGKADAHVLDNEMFS